MKRASVVVIVAIVAAAPAAGARVVLEFGGETALVGTSVDPLDFPPGVSAAILAEQVAGQRTRVLMGLGYRALWSDEVRDLMLPDVSDWSARSARGADTADRPLVFYGVQLSLRLGNVSPEQGAFAEFGAAAGRVGRRDFENDSYLLFGGGYAWPLSNAAVLRAMVAQRMHHLSEHSEVSLSIGCSWRPWR